VTTLASALGIQSTAEGVETEDALEALAAAGCSKIQRYLFCCAVPSSGLDAVRRRLNGIPTPTGS